MSPYPFPKCFGFFAVALLTFPATIFANGIDRNGVGARSMGVAGASLADFEDAMTSASQNPAALGFIKQADLYATVAGAWAKGTYMDKEGFRGSLEEDFHALPELAFRTPVGENFAISLSVVPDSSREADWYIRDPVGGAGGDTSYGWQHYQSLILNVRSALGVGWRISDSFSIGANVGVVYTENELASPYVFQSHPVLAGMKTMLDLETDGYGVNGDLAMAWKASDKLSIALSYRTPTKFDTSGTAEGDIGNQLEDLGLNVPSSFNYDADIETALPQKAALGGSYQIAERLRVMGQLEWVNWSRAFDDLKVLLTNGSNDSINGLLGTDELKDTIALDWKDRFVYRVGAEYDVTSAFSLRAGYTYGKSPIPGSTLLPQTAGISEHTVAAGIGYKNGPFHLDLAYQRDLKASQQAGSDSITGTEYDDSEVSLEAGWVGLTLGIEF